MAEPSNHVVLPVASPTATEIDSGSASDTAHDDQEIGDPFMIGDDFMNGSCMPGMTDSQELAVARALAPPQVVWAVPDVLAVDAQSRRHDPAQSSSFPATLRSPAWLPPEDGAFAVGAMMRQALGCSGPPGVEASDGRIDWCFPHGNDDPFQHCCRMVNALDVPFYIGITEDPRRRFGEHTETRTVGPKPLMTVLVEARSSDVTAALEIELLKRYRNYLLCANLSSGGEGRSASSPHYLYVVHAYTPLIRRRR